MLPKLACFTPHFMAFPLYILRSHLSNKKHDVLGVKQIQENYLTCWTRHLRTREIWKEKVAETERRTVERLHVVR